MIPTVQPGVQQVIPLYKKQILLNPTTPKRVTKPPGVTFAGTKKSGGLSNVRFSIFKLMMLTGLVGSLAALWNNPKQSSAQNEALLLQKIDHEFQLDESHKFSDFKRLSKQSMLLTILPYEDCEFEFFQHQLDFMAWDSWKMEKVPQGESPYAIYPQRWDVFSSLKADEAFLKARSYPLSQTDLKDLYQNYLLRPDSEEALKSNQKAPPALKVSSETLKALKKAYPLYGKQVNGKQNPVSLDEFSMMADIHHFFSHTMVSFEENGLPEAIFHDYAKTVLAKHAQNPQLLFVKTYYESATAALKQLTEDDKQLRNSKLKHGATEILASLFALVFLLGLKPKDESPVGKSNL